MNVRVGSAAVAVGCVCLLWAGGAQANEYYLQADGYGRAEPGMALLVAQGQGEVNDWISAEAMVWGGLRDEDGDADVLTVSVQLRAPENLGAVRLGRFVEHVGALRPVHVDGASGWVRLPQQFRLEAFGGVPVLPDFEGRNLDWVFGTRLSRGLGDWGSVGVAYLQRRDASVLADHEVGIDAGAAIADGIDARGKLAYDLVNPGVSEARAAIAYDADELFGEVFATHRSPSRILPATSLFTVLGDVASNLAGVSGRWRVAPRLDLQSTAAVRVVGDEVGPSLRLATVLRLDPFGQSSVMFEGRRESAPESDWTGARIALRIGIWEGIATISEIELVVPDDPGEQRGDVWPWALAGLTWDITERWRVAGVVQGESSPQYESRLDGMVRVTHSLEGGR